MTPRQTCSVPSGSTAAIAQTKRAVRSGAGHVVQLAKQQFVVVGIGGLRTGPAGRPYAGHAVQHVDLETGVVGESREAGGGHTGAGLEQRIAGEGALGLGRLGVGRHVGQSEDLDVRSGLNRRSVAARRASWRCGWPDDEPGGRGHRRQGRPLPLGQLGAARRAESRAACPARRGRTARPSAVPCTSMNLPSPLITMFMSTSAADVLAVAQVEHRRAVDDARPTPRRPTRSAARRSAGCGPAASSPHRPGRRRRR